MTCEQFFDKYMVDRIENYVQESYWDGEFDPDYCLEIMLVEANTRGIRLKDIEEFDYQEFFFNFYNVVEKVS